MIAKKSIPAVGYVRMSSSKQEKSPEQQREEIQKLADRQGYRIIRWYDWDMGISGDDTKRRKAFQQMSADAKTKRDFKVILCWDYSRFGRFDSIEGGKWIAPLRDAGVQLVTCTEGLIDWTSFTGRVMNALYSEGKNQYLIDLSKNVIRGKLKSAKAGHLCGSAAPLGYDRVVVDPQTNERTRLKRGKKAVKPVGWYTTLDLSDDPFEVDTVKWIFEMFTTRRVSLQSIARELNKRGSKGTLGGRWTTGRVKGVLAHPVYCGDLAWNRTRRGKYFCYFKGDIREDAELAAAGIGSGGKREMPAEEWVLIKDAVPSIVPRETWESAQGRLQERSRTHRQPREGGHPLSGYVYCGHCGHPMYGAVMRKQVKGGLYEYSKYRCRSRMMFADERCGTHEVHEKPLVDFVLKSIRDVILSDDNMQRIERELARQLNQASEVDPGQRKRLTKAISNIEAKIAKGTENILLADREEIPAMRELLADWRRQRDALRAELEAVSGPQGATKAGKQRLLQAAIDEAQRLSEDLDSDDPARLREVIDALVDRIDLWFSKVKTGGGTYRYPFSRGLLVLKADFFSHTVDGTSR
jgi:DNA invertase Pin-like site-specific DNA recombinase